MRIVSKVFLLFCILSLMSCQKDPQIQAAYDLSLIHILKL